MTLPAGYQRLSRPGVDGFALASAFDRIASALDDGATLHEWARSRADAAPLLGRGAVYRVPASYSEDGSGTWAVRHYRRGGAASRALGDRYLRGVGPDRPLRELSASHRARQRGVRTPTVVAGATYARGVFYRADLVTELVPDALTLAEAVSRTETPGDRAKCLRASGGLVRALEEARVIHPDLNARNVLLTHTGGALAAHVVDLDRGRVLASEAPRPTGPMRARLERSLRRLGVRTAHPLDDADWAALRAGYEDDR